MAGKRIESIDFWRGAVLAAIFVNHIPGNILGNLTPRNYGFSDAAEAFVFLSGLSVALAYSRRFETSRSWTTAKVMMSRATQLYWTHIFLTALALALFGGAWVLTGQEALLSEHGRGTLVADPMRGFIGVVTLGHQIGYFNILPLYVVLLACAPVFLLAGLRDKWAMLFMSAGVYVVARLMNVNFPSWPDAGVWFFNPFTWQFMFALGIFAGLIARREKFPVRAGAYRLAAAFTFVAALVVSNFVGLVPDLADAVASHLDRNKTDLGTVRIVDFLALAYMIYCSGLSGILKKTPIFPSMSLLGRHSLAIFSAGSLLSVVGQILNAAVTNSPFFDIVIVLAGVWILHKLASHLECAQRPTSSAPTAAPAAESIQTEELSFTG
ncbi:MAG: OpgC family protein [Methylocystis sp.]